MQIRIRYFKKKNMKNKGIQGIFGNCFLKQFYILQNKKKHINFLLFIFKNRKYGVFK